jgi:ABC-type amino acid transport system permease subunit
MQDSPGSRLEARSTKAVRETAIVHFHFNAWAKYSDWQKDRRIPERASARWLDFAREGPGAGVPRELRESAYALGGRKAGTIVRVVLPAAAPGIISGALLAVARAAGETAPLLFTIGISRAFHPSLTQKNTALPMEIWNNAQQPYPASQDRAWGAALTLITIVFVLTVIARIVAARFSTKPN